MSVLASCSDDTPLQEKVEIKVSKTQVFLKKGTSETITIQQGIGPFNVKSLDKTKLKAEVKSKLITLTGLEVGETSVLISDSKGNKTNLKVTILKESKEAEEVKILRFKYTNIKIGITNEANVPILNGSGEYKLDIDEKENITAEVKGGRLVVTALKEGVSIVTLTDIKTGLSTKITVNVLQSIDFEISKDNFMTYDNEEEVRVYNGLIEDKSINNDDYRTQLIQIKSGSGIYSLEFTQEGRELLEATIDNGVIKIKSKNGGFKSVGSPTITIIDDVSGKKINIKVRVIYPTDIKSDPLTIRLNKKSDYVTFDHYVVSCNTCLLDHIKITSDNPNTAIIEMGDTGSFNKGFRVIGKSLGTATVTISDGVRDDIEIPIEVIKNVLLVKTGVRVLTNNDKINLNKDSSIIFEITGSGNYTRTYSSNITEESFTTVSGKSILTLKSTSVVGINTINLEDASTGEKINFKIDIVAGVVYNCDPNGDFKCVIDYAGATHDDTNILAGKKTYSPYAPYECEETITMSVGDVLSFKFCGGSPTNGYELATPEFKVGESDLVDVFESKVKLNTTSTITARKAGEIIIFMRGYKIDTSIKGYKYYKVVIK